MALRKAFWMILTITSRVLARALSTGPEMVATVATSPARDVLENLRDALDGLLVKPLAQALLAILGGVVDVEPLKSGFT
jgi:hypothetical protein